MSTRSQARASVSGELTNQVRLVGHMSGDPELRTLPSGDPLWTFRVVIPRDQAETSGSRATAQSGQRARTVVDALDCCVWGGRSRRAVMTWRAGDLVEIEGAMRRRFFRAGPTAVSRVEVEVSRARMVRRRPSA